MPGKGVPGQNSVFEAGLLPHEKLAMQGAQKPKPRPTPPPPPPQQQPPRPASKTEPRKQSSGSDDQDYSRRAPLRKVQANPPPLPPGAEYPQLRRRTNVDDFEALSPFNLPSKVGNPKQEEAARQPNDPLPTPAYDKPKRKPPSGLPKSDRYPAWGKPSDLGAVAPEPVDKVRDFNRNIGDVAPDPVEVVLGNSGRRSTHARSQAPEKPGAPRSAPQAPGSQDTSAPSESVDVPSTTQEAADAPTVGEVIADPLLEGRRRGFDRPSGPPKRRSSNRRHDFEDDVDSGFDYEAYRMRKEEARRRKEEKRAAKEALAPKTILLPEYISVSDLAGALGVRIPQFLEDLGELGFENILHDSIMTGETAALVAAEYGFDPTVDAGDEEDLKPRPPPEDPSSLPARPPIVTIMGHVDHGKTTMLDWLRKSSVAAQEQGGITQHIGAFSVRLSSGKNITFLDTPGHAAFLSMRQRGANVTDIVVLVVAVDDSVKPQTLEALKHAQNAKVPIIVAINKVDKDPYGIKQVKQDLAANGVEIEDFGGDVQVVAVSGKTGQGMNDLEESILTLSEILDVRSEVNGMAEGWILEASVKKHHGKAATVLVKRGTMRVGDLVVAGTTYAKIRMMRNEAGLAVQEAGPGTPVEVLGWRDSPSAGDMVLQAPDEDRAQAAVAYRQESADRAIAAAQKGEEEVKYREKLEQEELEKMMAEETEGEGAAEAEAEEKPGTKTVNILIRGDVMGSVEAVCTAVEEIGNNEVRPRILRSSVGQISESDVDLAAAAKACIINFNNDIPGFVKRKADDQGVKILDHGIIYALVDDVKQMLSQQLAPITSQRVVAEAEVLEVFAINVVKRKFKNIAGVRVRTGIVTRGGLYRVMRDGEKIHDGKLDALKQGKKDVSEMRKGTECGLSFEDYDDFKAGDIVQLYEEIQEKRYL
ncbi:hypothetical protein VPNG_02072 [Cytospora leucostoma]|uniref:Translation initiation factor IF-2, mitochondrial n=1 Tax=Cytospora leucostoma TaxID=1230097 RepID=A0A423XH60_9PEZI|nr:hypothetical protein VPNG_02072 [Cytospora leucostoma]